MMAVDGTAETFGFADTIGPQSDSPGTQLVFALTSVSYTHLDVYKRQGLESVSLAGASGKLRVAVQEQFKQ